MESDEIFLGNSKGWKEEAQAVIQDVKKHVKTIEVSEKLQVNRKMSFLLNLIGKTFAKV